MSLFGQRKPHIYGRCNGGGMGAGPTCTECQQRDAVVAEALTWLRTPYRSQAQAKGAGVDCAMLPAAVYAAAGVIDPVKVAHYPPDWHLHRDDERYLAIVQTYAVEIEGPPQPGDFVMWRFGRSFSHGAIVVAWPTIIHAYIGQYVQYDDATRAAYLTHIGENVSERGKPRPRKFFTLKCWADPAAPEH